jgi:hypothetical protein
MTTELWSAPNIHLAVIGEDVIVLDLIADRYDCLVDAARLLHLETDGRIRAADASIAEALIQSGIGALTPLPRARGPLVAPVRETAVCSRPNLKETIRASIALAAGSLAFRHKSLSQLVSFQRVRIASSGAVPIDDLRLAEMVGAARRARPWIPFEGECLQRSFQLSYFLSSRGVATDWVFGVRTWPFTAHCWLQIGDLILGDRLERVARFTPIMKA